MGEGGERPNVTFAMVQPVAIRSARGAFTGAADGLAGVGNHPLHGTESPATVANGRDSASGSGVCVVGVRVVAARG